MLGAGRFGAAILATIGVGCTSTVDMRIDQRRDLSGYCTWNFLSIESGNTRWPLGEAPLFDARLIHLVERGLLGRGFTRTSDRPDFFVTYALEVRRERVIVSETPAMETLNSLHNPWGSPSYEIQATEQRVEVYETGHLRIFVSDPDEMRVVWRGEFEGRFRGTITRHLEYAVASLLERLPASSAASGPAPEADAPSACPASSSLGREIGEAAASGIQRRVGGLSFARWAR